MKDKKPRASYRRGRGVAMAPKARDTFGPKMLRQGGGSKAPNAVPIPKPTMPVSTGRPKAPTLVSRGGRPQAPTLPVARGGRSPVLKPGRGASASQAQQAGGGRIPVLKPGRGAAASQAQQAGGGRPLPPTAAVMRPRGNRQMLNKGGKAGYGSVQEMEKACMVKSDHNPSMRQK